MSQVALTETRTAASAAEASHDERVRQLRGQVQELHEAPERGWPPTPSCHPFLPRCAAPSKYTAHDIHNPQSLSLAFLKMGPCLSAQTMRLWRLSFGGWCKRTTCCGRVRASMRQTCRSWCTLRSWATTTPSRSCSTTCGVTCCCEVP